MGRNNHEPSALMTLPDLALDTIADTDVAAWYVWYVGLRVRQWDSNRLDELPDLEPGETEYHYTKRIWDSLTFEEKAEAAVLGVQRSMWYQDCLDLGIQLSIWRAWKEGLWTHGAEAVTDIRTAFRLWVEGAVPEDRSPTEISQLTSTVLNIDWLEQKEFVEDPEQEFSDPTRYSRWRRAASGLKRHIEAYNEAKTDEEIAEIEQDIMDLVEKVRVPDYSLDEIDRASRKKPRIPVLVFTVQPDGMWTAYPTKMQAELLKARMGSDIEIKLKGEE